VVNDLLDPGRPTLRLREDRRRGSHVEGAREETLLDADHALALIAAGDANRKVLPCALRQCLMSRVKQTQHGEQAPSWPVRIAWHLLARWSSAEHSAVGTDR
jgi:hypothetical protein